MAWLLGQDSNLHPDNVGMTLAAQGSISSDFTRSIIFLLFQLLTFLSAA
jgi:hypothetical protein